MGICGRVDSGSYDNCDVTLYCGNVTLVKLARCWIHMRLGIYDRSNPKNVPACLQPFNEALIKADEVFKVHLHCRVIMQDLQGFMDLGLVCGQAITQSAVGSTLLTKNLPSPTSNASSLILGVNIKST